MKRRKAGDWLVRYDEDLASKARAEGWWGTSTLADALGVAAQQTPGRDIIVDGAARLTAANLHSRALALAGAMQRRMARGSVVSFMLPNWHEAAIIYLAATLSGMVANPILPSLRDHDLRFILPDAGTRMIFIPEAFRGFDYADMLGRIVRVLDDPPEVVVVRGEAAAGFIDFPSLCMDGAAFEPITLDADDVRMIMYTSGTTGRPKAVLHTHNTIHALIKQIGRYWLVEDGDRFLVPSPISHIGGSIYAFEAPLILGTTAVLMDRWEPADATAVMIAERITHMAGATPFLQQLLDAARATGTTLPDLKVFICGGASVPPSLIRDATGYFANARVSRVYGSTEVPVTTVGALERRGMPEAAETDGKPGIADIRIADNGEILVKGPQMLVGYVHAEDEMDAFDDKGYYRTGDQGRLTETGGVVVTGRLKDLIIRNGENISPKEVEDLLIGHDAIAEIAIVGVPDPRTGEQACAVIVPHGSARPDVTELSDFLGRFGLARFKYPERVELRDALPKNEAGKVLKHILRQQLSSG